MSEELKIEKRSLNQVEVKGEGFWIETCRKGHYSDIGNEKEIEVLSELKIGNWKEIIRNRFSKAQPWLYKIIASSERSLFLEVLPLKKGGKFLDVGSGWGQVSIPLARYGNVFCLDITLPRLNILKEIAKQEKANLQYICGNFCTFPFEGNQFDLIVFNGALEWIGLGAPLENVWDAQKAALHKTYQILNPGGIVYIGIENSLGLKYLLGAPDDHTGIQYFTFLNENGHINEGS